MASARSASRRVIEWSIALPASVRLWIFFDDTQQDVLRIGHADSGLRHAIPPALAAAFGISAGVEEHVIDLGPASNVSSSREVPLNWNKWVRQIHRWVSIIFTVTVIANFVALAQGAGAMPPPWVTYSPLLPLALLLFTGLYLFVLPYATKWRRGR
jgi:hypothetical protein